MIRFFPFCLLLLVFVFLSLHNGVVVNVDAHGGGRRCGFSALPKSLRRQADIEVVQRRLKLSQLRADALAAQGAFSSYVKVDENNELARRDGQTLRRRSHGAIPPVVTIPVIFHVLHNGAAEQNVSDAQIQSQIDVLNEDYSLLNADASTCDPTFAPLLGNVRFAFQLTDIRRVRSTKASTGFADDDSVTMSSQGGSTPVDPTKNLNMYSCNLRDANGPFLGYAVLPGSSTPSADVAVLTFAAVGRGGSAAAPYDLGRTATHEIGHWAGLFHTWGLTESCADDDYVVDTPLSDVAHFGCEASAISCSRKNFIQNFMDYQDDACMVGFTHGQVSRMHAQFHDSQGWRRTIAVPSCGDGTVDAVEECDDGLAGPNDGCTMCRIDSGYACNSTGCLVDPELTAIFSERFLATGATHAWSQTVVSGSPVTPAFRIDSSRKAPAPNQDTDTASMFGDMSTQGSSASLTSPQITLPNSDQIALIFWVKLDGISEGDSDSLICLDGIRFEVVENGISRTVHSDNLPYRDIYGTVPGTFDQAWCPMSQSQQGAWASTEVRGLNWRRVSVDLTSYRARNIQLRYTFRQALFSFSTSIGVNLDEIVILASVDLGTTTSSPVAPVAPGSGSATVQNSAQTHSVPVAFMMLVSLIVGLGIE